MTIFTMYVDLQHDQQVSLQPPENYAGEVREMQVPASMTLTGLMQAVAAARTLALLFVANYPSGAGAPLLKLDFVA